MGDYLREAYLLREAEKSKIKDGSKIRIGYGHKIEFKVDQHFSKFQKKMLYRCFGFVVEDYTEEYDAKCCGNCEYKDIDVSKYPCKYCQNRSEWEPKKELERTEKRNG